MFNNVNDTLSRQLEQVRNLPSVLNHHVSGEPNRDANVVFSFHLCRHNERLEILGQERRDHASDSLEPGVIALVANEARKETHKEVASLHIAPHEWVVDGDRRARLVEAQKHSA